MNIVTSRIPACMRQLHTTLTAATWPAHPTTGEKPLVVFGGTGLAEALERVILVGVPESSSRMEWVVMNPPRLDEEFTLLIIVESEVQGSTNDLDDGADAFTRLEQLCDVIQTSLRDQTTGQPIGGFTFQDGNGCNAWKWYVSGFRDGPRIDPTPEGWIASAELLVSFTTRV